MRHKLTKKKLSMSVPLWVQIKNFTSLRYTEHATRSVGAAIGPVLEIDPDIPFCKSQGFLRVKVELDV